MNPQSSPAEGVNFPMLVPTFQLGHMSNLVYISDAVMVEGPFEPLSWLKSFEAVRWKIVREPCGY